MGTELLTVFVSRLFSLIAFYFLAGRVVRRAFEILVSGSSLAALFRFISGGGETDFLCAIKITSGCPCKACCGGCVFVLACV